MSKFKELYQDPEFKQRHKNYILQKVPCICGASIARCNASHHKASVRHTKYLRNLKIKEVSEEIARLNAVLAELLIE
jgi:hypothetical protein